MGHKKGEKRASTWLYFLKDRIVTRYIMVIILKCITILNHCVMHQEKGETEQENLSDKLTQQHFYNFRDYPKKSSTEKNVICSLTSYFFHCLLNSTPQYYINTSFLHFYNLSIYTYNAFSIILNKFCNVLS